MHAIHAWGILLSLIVISPVTSGLCQIESITIEDSEYDSVRWHVEVISEFGGSESHQQRLVGGNPDAYRFMQHTLPEPPGPQDLTRIEVIHIYTWGSTFPLIDSIQFLDYSEDIRLLSLPWPDGFVVSAPALLQNGVYYRCTQFISVVGDTSWVSGELTGLTETDFVAVDGSGAHPDFTLGDDPLQDEIKFGYWRLHTRGFTQPPVPPGEDLIYEHGSDNFTVTVYESTPTNFTPDAVPDQFLYLDYFQNTSNSYDLLANDFDPDGDSIWIAHWTNPLFGSIISSTVNTITYQYEESEIPHSAVDFFYYQIYDGIDSSGTAIVRLLFCVCPIECFESFLDPVFDTSGIEQGIVIRSGLDTLDLELFRRLRDDFLSPDTTGVRMIDFYYHAAPELMPLLLIDRQDLGLQAYRALQLMQPPLESLLDGDGSELITQALVDSVSLFLDSLLVTVSDSLRDSLNLRLAELCPLQDLVGLTVAEAAAGVFCDSMTTGVRDFSQYAGRLESVRPNPFTGSTTISFDAGLSTKVRISVTDLAGRPVRRLFHDTIYPGERWAVNWDGKDDAGTDLPAGMYFVHFKTGRTVQVIKTILIR